VNPENISRLRTGAVIYGLLLIIFAMHQLLIALHIHIPFADAYLDDLLVFPILLPAIGWMRKKQGWSDRVTLPTIHIILSVVIYSLWFEVIAPNVFHWGTSDPWDVVAYTMGAIAVWAWGRETQSI